MNETIKRVLLYGLTRPPRAGASRDVRPVRRLLRWTTSLAALLCACTPLDRQPDYLTRPTVALYYGLTPPVAALSAFDAVVIEPDSGFDPLAHPAHATHWFAYVSVGEVTPQRSWFSRMPRAWITGSNDAWKSRVVDQSANGWPGFYMDNVITPLWARGYRGFFLDTLDSYQLIAKTDAERARQQAGLVAVIRAIKARYPSAQLIFNRGFELLPQVHELAYVVAFESLYRGWNQAEGRYTEVSPADRGWLLDQTRIVHEKYGLPVLAIDYCAPGDQACARDTVAKIRSNGVIPYVTDGALNGVGVAANVGEGAGARSDLPQPG
jgi:polysaccharide biosynthesis protein PelA